MEQIRKQLEEFCQVSDKDWETFSSKLIRYEFSKRSPVLSAGLTENYLSFIEEGIIRFFIPGEENDLTFAFSFEGEFVSGYDSFLTRTTSRYTMETLTSATL